MNVSKKRKNPFEVLGLHDGELSLSIIENAYHNMKKNLENRSTPGSLNQQSSFDDLEKAFQELVGYIEDDSSQDPEEVVISASFLPVFHYQNISVQAVKSNNIDYMYKESDHPIKKNLNENISRPIDTLMDMRYSPKRVMSLSAKKPDLILSLEKIISGSENITGNLLKILREKMSVSIDEMSNKIKISRVYLEAIESDSFEKLPAEVYTKGFFNSYLNYIGLDRKDLVEALMEVYRAQKRLIKNK